jgi:hypothetical protein
MKCTCTSACLCVTRLCNIVCAGVGLSHLSGEVKRLLGVITKYDQDNYPEMLGHICVINAPWVFRTIWSVVKGMLDPRTQSKIEVRTHIGGYGLYEGLGDVRDTPT